MEGYTMKVKSKVLSAAMAFVLALGLCPSLAFAGEGGAASAQVPAATSLAAGSTAPSALNAQATGNMKQRGVKFDLKVGKSVKTKSFVKGVGKVGYTAKLSGLKVAKKSAGTKKATFTVTYKLDKQLTESQGKKVLRAWKKAQAAVGYVLPSDEVFNTWIGTHLLWFATDFQTGESLESPDNAYGVETSSAWSHSGDKRFGTDEGWFSQSKTVKAKVTITFPSDYENLCVGIGGEPAAKSSRTKADASIMGDSSYIKGGTWKSDATPYDSTYFETSYFKKYKSNFHFMRIS